MSDLELIYMKGYEPALYFFLEALILPWLEFPAIVWCLLLWWLYAAEILYWVGEVFFWTVFGGSGDPDYYYDKHGIYEDDDKM